MGPMSGWEESKKIRHEKRGMSGGCRDLKKNSTPNMALLILQLFLLS